MKKDAEIVASYLTEYSDSKFRYILHFIVNLFIQ